MTKHTTRRWQWYEVLILAAIVGYGVLAYFWLKTPDDYDRERKELWELRR